MNLSRETQQQYQLSMKTVTWQKDSHSLFDYEFNKNVVQNTYEFSLTSRYIFIFRNNQNSEVSFKQSEEMCCENVEGDQLLGCFCIKEQNKKVKIDFFNNTEIRNKQEKASARTNSSAAGLQSRDEDIYLIVRSLKNKNNQNKGYKLNVGHIIKLGRVEYLITSINNNNSHAQENKTKFWANNKKIVVEERAANPQEPLDCKYCMLGQGTEVGQFLCSPCKCSGSCGMVHFKCLEKWNQSKVKKEVIGGTIQYNFEKFYCQVCKEEYPRFIEKDKVEFELLPIDKPAGNHLMLEGISEKANNMMVIQNIPQDGIKLGRGHECEIRITDISVSRNHARIDKIGDDYYIFDNKSKFGTLIKEDHLSLELTRIKQGIQIGRTVITFEKVKKL